MTRRLGAEAATTGRVVPDRLLDTHLAHVLFEAQHGRRTGTLTVDEETVQTRLRIVDGTVVFAEAGTLAETLGRVLLRSGTLDREEYLLIIDRMAEPSERDEVARFGEVAIQLGMLSPAELGEALALQVRVKLQHCLLVDDATWSWRDGAEPSSGATFPTPLEPALREALREDPQGYRWPGTLAAHRRRVVQLLGEPDAIARRFGATAGELRLLRHMHERPLETVLSTGVLQPHETGALVACLLFAGVLQLGRHVSDRLVSDPLRSAATGPGRRPAMTESSEPDSGAEPLGPASAESRARNAAEGLRAEMERRGHPATSQRSRLDAERVFERGRALLAGGNTHAAREHLERATRLMPEAAEYALHLRWCEYLDETDAVLRPAYEHLLRGAVLEALGQDRKLAFGHYVQGRLFLLDDDEAAAERAFQVAGHLAPNDLEIARHLRLVQRRRKS